METLDLKKKKDYLRNFYTWENPSENIALMAILMIFFKIIKIIINLIFLIGVGIKKTGKLLTPKTLISAINNDQAKIVETVVQSTDKKSTMFNFYGKSISIVTPIFQYIRSYIPLDFIVTVINSKNGYVLQTATVTLMAYLTYLTITKMSGRTSKDYKKLEKEANTSIEEFDTYVKNSGDTKMAKEIKKIVKKVDDLKDHVEKKQKIKSNKKE